MADLLIVVDMQNDFIAGALGSADAQAIVPYVISKIKDFKGSVIFTKDTHGVDYFDTEEGRHLPVMHAIRGTWGHRIQDDVADLIDKYRFPVIEKDTFGSKLLISHLLEIDQTNPIDSLELIGLHTDTALISNAMLLKAYFPLVPIKVDAKGCAGVSRTGHQNALNAMGMCHIDIVNE
jgi:nicotinamidase-related amidase